MCFQSENLRLLI
jgi:hypothetical protein